MYVTCRKKINRITGSALCTVYSKCICKQSTCTTKITLNTNIHVHLQLKLNTLYTPIHVCNVHVSSNDKCIPDASVSFSSPVPVFVVSQVSQ